jgi:hypothetical protein
MSEYQYYEFQAIDRPLTTKEQGELRSYSTRARITATSFINDYSWGSFKGNPDLWMEKYFDAFLYLANWGTRILKLRLPSSLLPVEDVRTYCYTDLASATEKEGKIILSFVSEEEPTGEWEEGENWLSSIIPVRSELARGDHRCLYLAWLLSAQNGELDEEEEEPAVPDGLEGLSGSLKSLTDFLRIDPDLLQAAAQVSQPIHIVRPSQEDLLAWVGKLPAQEKDALLVRFSLGEELHLGAEIIGRYLKQKKDMVMPSIPKPRKRTVGELLRLGEEFRDNRRRAEAEKAAQEKAQLEAKAAAHREKYLEGLASREMETWLQVDRLIATKQPGRYEEAVRFLVDLRDVAVRKGKMDKFLGNIAHLRKQHEKKPSFLKRMEKADL